MNWLKCGIAHIFCILVLVKCARSVDLHVLEDWSNPTQESKLIFNASNGDGWSYHIDRNYRNNEVNNILSLDSSSGHIYTRVKDICKYIPYNPIEIRIIGRTLLHSSFINSMTNYTVVPLTIHFHDLPCNVPVHRKAFHSLINDYLRIDIFSESFRDWSIGRCIERDTVLFQLSKYIPHTLQHSMICDFHVEDEGFTYNKTDASVSTSSLQCLYGTEIIIPFKIEFCKEFQSTSAKIKVNIHDSVSENVEFHPVVKRIRDQTRMRRETTDVPPKFAQKEYRASVLENQPTGTSVIIMSASDPDIGEAGKITYRLSSIMDTRSEDMFTIDPISGWIKTTQPLDREEIPRHMFMVTATDSSPYQKMAQVNLIIDVEDENDHVPTFAESVYRVSKPENIPVTSTILTVRATDGDAGKNQEILYAIIQPPSSTVFKIDRNTGSISTLKVLDREEKAHYVLVVQAVDQAPFGKQKSSSTTIDITVLDENDNFPQFDQSSYTVTISENLNITNSPVIAHISAMDADEGKNQQITYSITSGNLDSTFSIDQTTGEVSVQKALDYEHEDEYRLKVKASDNGEAAKTNSTTLWIRIEDLNDNPPYFQSDLYQGSVLENEKPGKSVLTVHALDIDSGENKLLEYSILNAPPSLPFAIDPDSGQISVRATLDREIESSYMFTVEVKDKGKPPLSATSKVEISVRDINDNSPIFLQKTYYVSISEDTPLYKQVAKVIAVDADEGEYAHLVYVISSGNNDQVFAIGRETGIITLVKNLDYKVQNRYILTVRASDSGNKFDSAEVHINVTDINKHVPTFEKAPYELNVDEGSVIGKSVGKVQATDLDVGENGRITYELVNGIKDFAIDPNSGVITTREVLDRELESAYSFDVRASDNGLPPLSDTVGVLIIVNDKNDNAPRFDQEKYTASVSEAAFDGTFVVNVHANDEDSGINAQVRYKFGDGSDGIRDFEIDPASGDILVAKNSAIDREVQSHYNLTIYAVDRGVIALTGTTEVLIDIEDINDNAPKFASNPMKAYVKENMKIGSTVAVISAVDPDEGPNADIEYSFEGGLDADKFILNSRPGDPAIIVNYVDLDYESDKKMYEIRLKASSGNLFTSTLVQIFLLDQNDNKPILKDFVIIFNNFVDHFPLEPIGRVPAFDPDEADQDKLIYTVLTGNETKFLHVNEFTGEIKLESRLNSDVPRNGTLQVQVSDGLNVVKATCRLYVRLVTEEMLHNSVTIRINNMTSSAFLSPLFTFFVDALASIINTDKANIFLINVRNDTDVKGQILNVTVSVRKASVRVDRQVVDQFYESEYLKEQIYLHRTLLANLSTLQILPFDDNLCLQEVCGEFAECRSILRFGVAAPFITSDTMLFRPIYPENGYDCVCPKGFSGVKDMSYLCSTEVDLCYSNPCNGSGVCQRKEGGYTCKCKEGFTGENCEIDLSKKYEAGTCPEDVCRPPSSCVPLIQGGVRCEGCPNNEDYNQFCQMTTRSFQRGSFLMFPTLKSRYRFQIKLKFATQMRDGLLFYNGRFNDLHDFVALEIVNAQVQFSFSVGAGVMKVSPYVEGGVNDGQWHQVTVDYLNMTATVTLGEECDTEISVRYGKSINYTCAARDTYNPNCSPTQINCLKMVNLMGPLQVGGLPTLPSSFQVNNTYFVGCIKDFEVDGKLMDFNMTVANNGTEAGCPVKRQFCRSAPCQHGGTCVDGWGTYRCLCASRWGGKDCSQNIDVTYKVAGQGYLYYSNRIIQNVYFPWYNGISFRTRHADGTLMYIVAEKSETVHIELVNGYLTYTYVNSLTPQVFVMDAYRVDDGHWHYFESRWNHSGILIMTLDYGQRVKLEQIQSSLFQKSIQHVYVGARKSSTQAAPSNYFIGCVKNVRVGNQPTSVLLSPETFNTTEGCPSFSQCSSNPCAARAQCIDEWEGYTCKCPPGTLGENCDNICTNFNPCQNRANCRHPQGGSYQCECGQLQSGKYCEVVAKQPCPARWWGYPVCGPCDETCTKENGFRSDCDNLTGKCSCLDKHYKPAGSNKCLPCNCYGLGSNSLECDTNTGQCPCKEGIVGKQCNQCTSQYAEIRLDMNTKKYTCKVDYEACPRIFSHGMWWDSERPNTMVVQECPNKAVGEARRNCSPSGLWEEPDFFNCTNQKFIDHLRKLEKLESGGLTINKFVANTTMTLLAQSTGETEMMYGSDLNITLRLMNHILDYELNQTGLDLTSEQYSKYLSHVVGVLSDVLQPKYQKDLAKLNKEGEGTDVLLVKLESYLSILLSALEMTALASPRPYSVITENIVLTVDTVKKSNFSGKFIPKYDNIVKSPTFDGQTNIFLPQSIVREVPLKDFLHPEITTPTKAYVGFIMFRYLGDLLPKKYSSNVRVISDRPMSINSPVFTIIVHDEGRERNGSLSDPVVITFKQQHTENRSSPQCAYWDPKVQNGAWSTSGCTMVDRYELNGEMFVKCSCNHMTSFALLMDISDKEYEPSAPVQMEVITFICLILCMSCMVLCFVIFMCFKRLVSNTTSIRTNLVFVIFVSLLTFLIGINRTDSALFCRLTSIMLHYFYMTGFSWLFVEILHIYRMLTEIRNIDQGSMKFYYLIAYVIPGIIVSLAVGLNTEGYGNDKFCWLLMSDKFIWSFAGPITLSVIANIFVFVLAVKASCREKVSVSDLTPLRFGMFGNIIVLMMWGIIWVVGLLAVNFNYTVLHYINALLCLALGVFVFIVYIIINHKVRLELKKLWYKCQGKKLDLDDNIAGTRSSLYSRSALAYRNDSCDGGMNRINVGISTTSTTSRSTSKSSGGLYKGEDYLRSTSTSTSGNMPPVKYPKTGGLPPPYGYDPEKPGELDPDSIQIRTKREGNDSDSDSEMSERVSLDLASSISSDDDDDEEIDAKLDWEKQLPKNKKIEEAKEQARQKKLETDSQQQQQQHNPQYHQYHTPQHTYQNPFDTLYSGTPPPTFGVKPSPAPGQWPGDPQLAGYNGSDTEYRPTDPQPTLSSVQPDVTLQTPEYKGREFIITPPRRTDSLLNDSNSNANKGTVSSPFGSPHLKHNPRGSPSSPIEPFEDPGLPSPRDRMMVKVLTHRGSVSSDSECSHETCV